jgi:hypothetical protein
VPQFLYANQILFFDNPDDSICVLIIFTGIDIGFRIAFYARDKIKRARMAVWYINVVSLPMAEFLSIVAYGVSVEIDIS